MFSFFSPGCRELMNFITIHTIEISGFTFIKFNSSGTGKGGSADWAYCDSKLCDEGQGDCDNDSQCKGSLQCGTDNCKNYHDIADPSTDCCYRTGIIFVGCPSRIEQMSLYLKGP